jgi:hypothetical protein
MVGDRFKVRDWTVFGGKHLLEECSTVLLLPDRGAASYSSPPSVHGYTFLDMDFVMTFFLMATRDDVFPDGDSWRDGGVPKICMQLILVENFFL